MMAEFIEALNISSSPLINAAISMLAFVLLAKLTDLIITHGIRRMTSRTKSDFDDRVIDILHRPIFLTIILIGLMPAIQYLNTPQKIVFYVNAILYTLLCLIWMMTVIRLSTALISDRIRTSTDVTGLSKDVLPLIENIIKVAAFIVAINIILSAWQVNITPLLASAGIVGAGLAIAAKDTVSNLFGGISVFLDRPFKVGDYIVLDQGERGAVVSIGLRSTRIETRDHIQIIIPNAIIASSKIVNESAPEPNFRVRIPITVAYGSDIDLVQKTLMEVARGNANIVKEQEPKVRFRRFGDSALEFELLCWATEPAARGLTIHEINCEIYKRFREEGITIPFPQRDVHIHTD